MHRSGQVVAAAHNSKHTGQHAHTHTHSKMRSLAEDAVFTIRVTQAEIKTH